MGHDVLSLFFDLLSMGCLHDQTLPDVRTIGAGIKFLYCMSDMASSNRYQLNHIMQQRLTDIGNAVGYKIAVF